MNKGKSIKIAMLYNFDEITFVPDYLTFSFSALAPRLLAEISRWAQYSEENGLIRMKYVGYIPVQGWQCKHTNACHHVPFSMN